MTIWLKTTRISIVIFALCSLFSIFAVPAIAWDWPCPDDCYEWTGSDCIWVIGDCGVADPCPDEVHFSCAYCECVCDADPYYTQNTVITPVSITSPSDGDVFCIGTDIGVSCSTCTDSDIHHHCVDNIWTEEPVSDSITYTWSGSGTFDPATGTSSTFTPSGSAGSKTIGITASDTPKHPDTHVSHSITVYVVDTLIVVPSEAYVCINCTKDFSAWACVGGTATDVTSSATFTTNNGSFSGNTLTASSTPSTSEGSDWVKATYDGETTDADHDCDLTVFKVNITTPTSTPMNITTAPAMPSITFHADIEPEDILSKTTFKWYLNMTFTHDTLGELTHRVPTSGTDDVEGNENWTPNWGGLLAGGDVHVYVQASVADSTECPDDQSGYQIKGTNPTQSQIFGIADLRARAVCWKESTHRQFNAIRYTGIAMPLASYAHDGGYGLMQPTPASEAEVWNWSTNLNAGITHLSNAYSQSVQHVSNINTPGIAPNPDPTPDPELTMTVAQHWMNAYSLYRKGTYYYGYELVSGTEYQWVRNSGTGSDYADDVADIINDPPW